MIGLCQMGLCRKPIQSQRGGKGTQWRYNHCWEQYKKGITDDPYCAGWYDPEKRDGMRNPESGVWYNRKTGQPYKDQVNGTDDVPQEGGRRRRKRKHKRKK